MLFDTNLAKNPAMLQQTQMIPSGGCPGDTVTMGNVAYAVVIMALAISVTIAHSNCLTDLIKPSEQFYSLAVSQVRAYA